MRQVPVCVFGDPEEFASHLHSQEHFDKATRRWDEGERRRCKVLLEKVNRVVDHSGAVVHLREPIEVDEEGHVILPTDPSASKPVWSKSAESGSMTKQSMSRIWSHKNTSI